MRKNHKRQEKIRRSKRWLGDRRWHKSQVQHRKSNRQLKAQQDTVIRAPGYGWNRKFLVSRWNQTRSNSTSTQRRADVPNWFPSPSSSCDSSLLLSSTLSTCGKCNCILLLAIIASGRPHALFTLSNTPCWIFKLEGILARSAVGITCSTKCTSACEWTLCVCKNVH